MVPRNDAVCGVAMGVLRGAILAVVWACAALTATAADALPPSYGGRFPHLAVSNAQGECGIGAVVPWADKLWVITYGPHLPLGSDDGLYELDHRLRLVRRPESVGGTPAARLVHPETNTLVLGPYLIDATGRVEAVPPEAMEGRLTAHARHLTDPARKVLVYDMEGLLYELDLESREPRRLAARPVPGWHGKGAYSGQGVLVVANNGEHPAVSAKKFEPFLYAVPNTRASREEAGALAEWDGDRWRLIRRRQFTDVTGPGGIHGPPSPEAALWAIGWDEKSMLLMTRSASDAAAGQEPWHTFRLPIACWTYTGDHGWHTEWPRIREVVPAADGRPPRYLLTMHGGWYELPATFSAEHPAGVRPLCSHLKITGDVTAWRLDGRDVIVFGCDDTAKSGFKSDLQQTHNDLNGRSNSNLWFTTWEGLRELGRPAGVAFAWRDEPVAAGVPSDPLLLAGGPGGYDRRVVHLAHGGREAVTFTLTAGSGDAWHEVATVTVPAGAAVVYPLPDDVAGDWLRVTADRDAPATTVVVRYGTRGGQVADSSLFAALPDVTSAEPWVGAVVRSGDGAELPLDVLATEVGADGPAAATCWRYAAAADGPGTWTPRADDDPVAMLLRERAVPESPSVEFDAASVILREGKAVLRLPKPLDPVVAAAYETPFVTGWPRGLREVVTERSLLNAAGTFYVVPRMTSGGAALIQPVCSHGRRITDFCSWRGLLVLGGVRAAAGDDPRVLRNADGPAVWVGDIDELWKLPTPTGRGGPWRATAVEPGVPSDPYLMGGYDRKRLALSHDASGPVRIKAEIDPVGTGTWRSVATFDVPAGAGIEHEFPRGFTAQWIRFTADKGCAATATLVYE
jgi:hypothetical protein